MNEHETTEEKKEFINSDIHEKILGMDENTLKYTSEYDNDVIYLIKDILRKIITLLLSNDGIMKLGYPLLISKREKILHEHVDREGNVTGLFEIIYGYLEPFKVHFQYSFSKPRTRVIHIINLIQGFIKENIFSVGEIIYRDNFNSLYRKFIGYLEGILEHFHDKIMKEIARAEVVPRTSLSYSQLAKDMENTSIPHVNQENIPETTPPPPSEDLKKIIGKKKLLENEKLAKELRTRAENQKLSDLQERERDKKEF